jgi:hypothetical protein
MCLHMNVIVADRIVLSVYGLQYRLEDQGFELRQWQ